MINNGWVASYAHLCITGFISENLTGGVAHKRNLGGRGGGKTLKFLRRANATRFVLLWWMQYYCSDEGQPAPPKKPFSPLPSQRNEAGTVIGSYGERCQCDNTTSGRCPKGLNGDFCSGMY